MCKFAIFGIKKLHLSINENLLKKTLTFVEGNRLLSDDKKAIIHHARKSLLFNDHETWTKRDSGLFDVTIGAYNRAEVYELIGNYLFYQLSQLFKTKDVELHRDKRMAAFKNKSEPGPEKLEKSIQSIFRENDLKIIVQCNFKILDYLDVTFNLTDSSNRPFNKANNEIIYIHRKSP